MKVDLSRHVREGWTVGDFIRELAPLVDMIMRGESFHAPFRSKAELAAWCKDNQPYHKRKVAAVNNYFAKVYNLK